MIGYCCRFLTFKKSVGQTHAALHSFITLHVGYLIVRTYFSSSYGMLTFGEVDDHLTLLRRATSCVMAQLVKHVTSNESRTGVIVACGVVTP